jgi:hypothetical protein
MKLREGEDYYLLPDGRLVMTASYLLKRGWCCGNGCLHCPFEYAAVPEPKRSKLLANRSNKQNDDGKSA